MIVYLLKIFSFLPLKVIFFFSDIAYFFIYYIFKYRRKTTRDNLQNCFPNKSLKEIIKIEKKFYRHLSDMFFEVIKSISFSKEKVLKHCRLKNIGLINKHTQNNTSVILSTAHYCNWEWACLMISIVSEYPAIVTYKPQTSKNFEKFINNLRARFGAVMVSMKQVYRKLVELRGQTFLKVLVFDQTPLPHEAGLITPFLNQDTAFFSGTEKIAVKEKWPVFYTTIKKIKRGFYEVEFMEVHDGVKPISKHELTKKLVRLLEEQIVEQPEYWLWSHKRWKHREEMANLKNKLGG